MCPKLSCLISLLSLTVLSTLTSFMLLAMISTLVTLPLIYTEFGNIINQLHAGHVNDVPPPLLTQHVLNEIHCSFLHFSFLPPVFPTAMCECFPSPPNWTLWSYQCLLSRPPGSFKFSSVSEFQLYFYNLSTLHSLPQPHYFCSKLYNCFLTGFSNSTVSISAYMLFPGQFPESI